MRWGGRGRRAAVEREIRQLLERHALQGRMGQGIVCPFVPALGAAAEKLPCYGDEV